jgi:hypothetical protein
MMSINDKWFIIFSLFCLLICINIVVHSNTLALSKKIDRIEASLKIYDCTYCVKKDQDKMIIMRK